MPSSQHSGKALTVRPDPDLKAAATAALTARNREMQAFVVACLTALVADPDAFLATLDTHWPPKKPYGRPPRKATAAATPGTPESHPDPTTHTRAKPSNQPEHTPEVGRPDRVRALATPSATAPSSEHDAVWLEDDGQVWADYPADPGDDHMLPLVWADEDPQSRRDLEARGCTLTRIADCRTEFLATYRVPQADRSAAYAAVWLDNDGWVWADYPTAGPDQALVRHLVWASEEADSRRDLQDRGYRFTLIGWSQ